MRISVIGAGGVSTSLCASLVQARHEIAAIWSHTLVSAEHLATTLGVPFFTDDLSELPVDSDLAIIAVKDDALSEVARQYRWLHPEMLVVHTAGSVAMEALGGGRIGVFYPLQTFSREKRVDFAHVPLFIEASQASDLHTLEILARSLSDQVFRCTSEERQSLHVAAVFCCNFANHCATIAADLLSRHQIPFHVMLPLLDETVSKLHTVEPLKAQTGPAKRGDRAVMDKHLSMLEHDVLWHQIYELMSRSIYRQEHTDGVCE